MNQKPLIKPSSWLHSPFLGVSGFVRLHLDLNFVEFHETRYGYAYFTGESGGV
jgi:hypothetical protein